ncbi:MAG: ABC transporter ATP-binding protein [Fidelibacterota bacterium]
MQPLLQVRNLSTHFFTAEAISRAVDGISFHIYDGETLGLVGESGCGKSVSCLSIMRLIPQPPGRIVGGEILFRGVDLLKIKEDEMRKIRGNEISMIFQEPMTSLNPVFTCGDQIQEAIELHQKLKKKEAREKTIEMLKLVKIPGPEQRYREYPHQLSGGMRQRVMIAMALSCSPSLLIADEPTTALDVTVQAQILDLIGDLQKRFNMAVIIITHDFGVIAEIADRVEVMYAGKIVESASVSEIFNDPLHPYTLGLLNSIPKLAEKVKRLPVIEGNVPNPAEYPSGCRFHPRCYMRIRECSEVEPPFEEKAENHFVRCIVV